MTPGALDFMRAAAPRRLGWCLLVAGAAAVSSATWLESQWTHELVALQRQVAKADAAAQQRRLPPKPVQLDPAERLRQQVEAATRQPWAAMLRDIETATRDPIYLLGLTVETGTGSIRLDGEAENFDQVLAYLDRLSDCRSLKQVELVSHEVLANPQPAQGAIRFTVAAHWVSE